MPSRLRTLSANVITKAVVGYSDFPSFGGV